MSSPLIPSTGDVAVLPSLGMRTQVPSPWFSPLMKRVVKRVWALATEARPKSMRNFMIKRVNSLRLKLFVFSVLRERGEE